MAIEFVCPHCKTDLKGPDELKGKRGRCPKCEKELTVPGEGSDADDGGKAAAQQ